MPPRRKGAWMVLKAPAFRTVKACTEIGRHMRSGSGREFQSDLEGKQSSF
jgi:hypothetical protein